MRSPNKITANEWHRIANERQVQHHIIAYHEAGHVVTARKLDISIKYVSVRPHAMTVPRKLKVADPIEAHRREAIFTLAGPLAEWRYLGADDDMNLRDDDGDFDIIFARDSICSIICLRNGITLADWKRDHPATEDFCRDTSLDALLREKRSAIRREFLRLKTAAARLVEQHWCAIQRVSEALERHGRLNQTDLDRLIAV